MIQHGLLFTEENIQALFGNEAAEDEDISRLKEYYFKNDAYKQAIADLPLRIIVGHKGIGKSALFQVAMAEDAEVGNVSILVKPDDIVNLGYGEASFVNLVTQWKEGLKKVIFKKVFSKYNNIGDEDKFHEIYLKKYPGKIVNFFLDMFEGKLNEQNIDLRKVKQGTITSFLSKKKIIVYLDDLDLGWESRKEDIRRISALLNAIRHISQDLPGIQFRVALRTDVYFLVRTSDESTDKIGGSVVWYKWTNHEILVMLAKRIETFFGRTINEGQLIQTEQRLVARYLDAVMEKRFQGYGKWENAPLHRILMSVIRRRPRDLVKFCTLAAKRAYARKSNLIGTRDMMDVFDEYSQDRIQDAINEYKSELPDIHRLLFGMKPSRAERKAELMYRYDTPGLIRKINAIIQSGQFRFANGNVADEKSLAGFLYKINFLIARKDLSDGEIDRKYFEENRYLSSKFVDFGYSWEAHPAYRWALQPDTLEDVLKLVD